MPSSFSLGVLKETGVQKNVMKKEKKYHDFFLINIRKPQPPPPLFIKLLSKGASPTPPL